MMDGGTSQAVDLVDPSSIQNRFEFAAALTHLRNRAGSSVRAVARQLGQPVATIGDYFSGQHLPSVSQTELFRSLLVNLGVDDEAQLVAWLDALARVRQKPGPRSSTLKCPYPGLESFQTEDSDCFFGREGMTSRVVRRLAEALERREGAIVVLVGASGSGKSSLLKAGIVPAVMDGGLGPERTWQSLVVCPGEDPPGSLIAAWAKATGADPDHVSSLLEQPEGLVLPDPGTRGVLLVIDQFEETFTVCRSQHSRQCFLLAITRLASSPGVAVVLGLRADFYARAAQEPSLVPLLQDNQVIVGPLAADELRCAIVDPARRTGFAVEDALVQQLLDEVAPRNRLLGAHDIGALPLLSHALRETWLKARRGSMTLSDYRSTGGIAGAIQQSAEQTYLGLALEDRALARRVMLRLVNVDEAVSRRRASSKSLPGCTCGPELRSDCALHRVVDRFVGSRLLTADADTVEISHEALLTAWPRLRGWIESDLEGLRLRRQIGESAQTWEDSKRDPASLLRGGRLELALAWAENQEHADLSNLEQSFLKASVRQAEAEELASRRRHRRLQVLSAIVAVLAIGATALAWVAVNARDEANTARDTAQSRQLAIQASELRDVDSSLAMELSLLAYELAPTRQARSALIDSSALPSSTRILGQPGPTAVALSPDGGVLAVTGAGDASVQLFRMDDGKATRAGRLEPGVPADLYSVAFSPDGLLLASAATDGLVRLWNVADPVRATLLGEPLGGFDGAAWAAEFSPDGATLLTAGQADLIHRWDVRDPQNPAALTPLEGATGITQSVALSPDGSLVAAGGVDGVVRLWSPNLGARPLHELPVGSETTVTSIVFSPDGHVLAAAAKDKLIRLWRLDAPAPTRIEPPLGGFGSWVNDVAFTSDGRVLAGGSSDNSIRFWETEGWQPLEPNLSTSSPVTQLAFLPGRSDVVSAASDGTTRLWSWPGAVIAGASDNVFGLSFSSDGSRLAVLSNKASSVGIWNTSSRLRPRLLGEIPIPESMGIVGGTGAISPDGSLLATGMVDDTVESVQLWDIADLAAPRHLRALTGPTELIEGILFSRDGRYLAAAGDDALVRLWDLADESAEPAVTLSDAQGAILGIDFSPDGRVLAAAATDGSVLLWDVSDRLKPQLAATLEAFDHYAYSVAFNSNGTLLAAGSADKTVRLWEVSDIEKPKPVGEPLTGPGNYVFYVDFSPTEPVLAAAVTDGNVWQWDVQNPANPKALTTLTAAATTQVFAVRYSPDGRTLLASDGKVVRLWDPNPGRMKQFICTTAGDGITREEWQQYVPGMSYHPPC